MLSLYKCRACGMIFVGSSNYDSEVVHDLYWKMLIKNLSSDFSVYSGSQVFPLDELNKNRRTNRLLEIGCGDGTLLKLARDRGWQVAGIDISKKAVELAREQYELNVLNGKLNEKLVHQLGTHSFDVVIMWGLLEHLPEPLELLRLTHLLLRKGGIIIIYTPNADSVFHRMARLSYYLTCGLVPVLMRRVVIAMHCMYFTPKTLKGALIDCGFKIREINKVDINLELIFKAHSHFWWSNSLFFLAAKLLQKISHSLGLNSHMVVIAESI